jgi:tetratricopeptide (TPR) repeat protein
MKRLVLSISLFLLAFSANAAEMDDVGTITFPTSGSPEAQEHFLRGAAILHSFGWKQARTEFQAAQKLDPDFAMAYWGESLTYNHPLISEMDLETPRAVLMKLGSTSEERIASAPTDREQGFIAAVDALFFGEGDTMARRTAYMEVMRNLYERYPDDEEIAAYYALSLLSSAGPAGEGHRQNVLAGAIAMDISSRNPKHPGAVHYTIHAFDDPVHAPLALPAAWVFADIAEAVSHARHMPTHIFIQLGMWQQVSDSNQSAYDAAVALWVPGDSAGAMIHALDWGQYGDLQLGDYDKAALWIKRMEGIVERNSGQQRAIETLPRVRARMVLETQQWKITPITEESHDTELLATGISAVRLGELDTARKAADRLATKAAGLDNSDRSYYADTAKPVEIMQRSVAGLVAIAEGDTDKGLAMLAEGVEIAESMRPPNGAPDPLKPIHELYGEELLTADRPDEARAQFIVSLQRTPNRPLSLLGLARAYAALGDEESARKQYQKLADVWKGRDFPVLEEANRYLASADDAD